MSKTLNTNKSLVPNKGFKPQRMTWNALKWHCEYLKVWYAWTLSMMKRLLSNAKLQIVRVCVIVHFMAHFEVDCRACTNLTCTICNFQTSCVERWKWWQLSKKHHQGMTWEKQHLGPKEPIRGPTFIVHYKK